MSRILVIVSLALLLTSQALAGEVRTYETANGTFRMVSNFGGYVKALGDEPEPGDVRKTPVLNMRCDMIQDPTGTWHRGFPDTIGSINFFYDYKVAEGKFRTFVVTSQGIWRWIADNGFVEVFRCPGSSNRAIGLGMMMQRNRLKGGYFLIDKDSSNRFGGVVIYDPSKEGEKAWRLVRYTEESPPSGLKDVEEKGEKIAMTFNEFSDGPLSTVIFDKRTETFATTRREPKNQPR